jgi:hypothetical protein
MKICPKCRGFYFDQDEECSECHIKLYDKTLFHEIEQELYQMNKEQRIKHRFDERYEIICKYQYPYDYNYEQVKQESDRYYAELQRNARQRQLEQQRIEKQQNIPKCPTCGSTKVHPISAGKKAVGFLAVGVFSKNFGKSYECDDCKYRW